MIKACDLKRGGIVKLDGTPHIVEDLQIQTPSARGGATLYKIRFRNVRTRQKTDLSLKGDDPLQDADLERREVQYLFVDAAGYTFMDLGDYSQFTLDPAQVEMEKPFLTDGLEGIQALMSEGRVIGIQLPAVVELEITETDPAIRGATASARNKPARLSTGHMIKVPEYMQNGEIVRVDTRTGEFLSRA